MHSGPSLILLSLLWQLTSQLLHHARGAYLSVSPVVVIFNVCCYSGTMGLAISPHARRVPFACVRVHGPAHDHALRALICRGACAAHAVLRGCAWACAATRAPVLPDLPAPRAATKAAAPTRRRSARGTARVAGITAWQMSRCVPKGTWHLLPHQACTLHSPEVNAAATQIPRGQFVTPVDSPDRGIVRGA